MSMKIGGYLPNPATLPAGYALKPFSSIYNTFASKAVAGSNDYIIPSVLACYDQEQWGACVTNALTGVLNIVLELEGNTTTMLSRMFLYNLCRKAMGTSAQDSGTYPYLACERIAKIGICNEETLAYTQASFAGGIPPECYPEASDNKASAWFDVQGSGDDRLAQLDIAIRANHPVLFCTTVGKDIENYKAGQVLSKPSDDIGGHALAIVGIQYVNNKRCWRIRNSWGTSYGDNGHLLVDDDYMSWSDTRDLHLLTRMDPLLF